MHREVITNDGVPYETFVMDDGDVKCEVGCGSIVEECNIYRAENNCNECGSTVCVECINQSTGVCIDCEEE